MKKTFFTLPVLALALGVAGAQTMPGTTGAAQSGTTTTQSTTTTSPSGTNQGITPSSGIQPSPGIQPSQGITPTQNSTPSTAMPATQQNSNTTMPGATPAGAQS